MNHVSSDVSSMAAYSNSNVNQATGGERAEKKTRVSGRTIGNPKLSEKAAKYYEQLKKKYSNMDFILVSEDQKEQAQAQAGKYANANRMVVLIDEDKIERMAEDENFRRQYEGIISKAASGISRMKSGLSGSGAKVKTYGIKVNDNGTASYFAVLEKSTAAQKERIERKAQEKRAARKASAKEAEKKRREERLEEGRNEKRAEWDENTVTASSVEELIAKVQEQEQMFMSDDIETEEERKIGHSFDFSV